jgi:hypothetical protein
MEWSCVGPNYVNANVTGTHAVSDVNGALLGQGITFLLAMGVAYMIIRHRRSQ